jgi:hypothetical protein
MRAWIGLVAAYAFVLQALLATVVATQMVASPDSFAICLGSADDGNTQHQPADRSHAAHQACIICSFTATAAAPPLPAPIVLGQIAEAAVYWGGLSAPLDLSRQRSPRVPQGPPQIA